MGITCPVCAEDRESVMVGVHGTYKMYRCPACDLVFSDPMRTEAAFYEQSADYKLRDNLILDPLLWERRWDIEEFLKSPPRKSGNLIDIGCGTGFFVRQAIDIGFNAFGIEMNERSVARGKEHFGLDTLYSTDLDSFLTAHPDLKFDVVSMFQVIEHVEDPGLIIRRVRESLKDKGVLVLSMPYRDRWPEVLGDVDNPPHHLTRWSRKAMENLLQINGYRLLDFKVENFPLENMVGIVYSLVLRVLPSLTMRGRKVEDTLDGISEAEAVDMLKRRKSKMKVARILSSPIWGLLKLFGAKGPHAYIVAERV